MPIAMEHQLSISQNVELSHPESPLHQPAEVELKQVLWPNINVGALYRRTTCEVCSILDIIFSKLRSYLEVAMKLSNL